MTAIKAELAVPGREERCHGNDCLTPPSSSDLESGKINEDMSVEPTRPHQSVVQNISSIGRCQDDDMVCGAHS